MAHRAGGFSLVELIIAMALTTMVVAGVFAVVQPAQGVFAIEPERADMQQRLRLAVETLTRDLSMAGSGLYPGTSNRIADACFPAAAAISGRSGTRWRRDDCDGCRHHRRRADHRSADDARRRSSARCADAAGSREPGCPVGTLLCGFSAGVTVGDLRWRRQLRSVHGRERRGRSGANHARRASRRGAVHHLPLRIDDRRGTTETTYSLKRMQPRKRSN